MPEPSSASDARRAPPRPPNLLKCRNCFKIKKKTRPWQRFCNSKCRNSFHNDNRKLETLGEE